MLVSQIETPALILDLDTFEHNLQIMSDFCKKTGIALRPHYKSHKCTAIAHMQLDHGAKGLCCAKLSEAEDLANAGVEDILIANQILDDGKIARAASLAKCCRLTICVDQAENMNRLEAAAALQGSSFYCLVEYDVGMNRCGVYTPEDFYALVHQMEKCPHLIFEGIQAYAGNIAHWTDYEKRSAYSKEVEKKLRSLKAFLESRGITVKEVSGMSTGTILLHADGTIYTEAQAGSFIFMDAAYNALNLVFENALFLLTSIISKGPGHLVTDAGLKSVSVDQAPPYFLEHPKLSIDFSEEHSALLTEEGAIGDRLRMIPSHCCTTVNLHDSLYLIRQGKVVDRVPVTSRGKSR